MLRVIERPHRLAVRLDELERAAVERAAARAGLSLSDWVRQALQLVIEAESEPVNVFVQAHARRQR